MIAVSLDNLLFLLLVAVAALFQLLAKTISKTGKDRQSEHRAPTRTPRANATRATGIRRRPDSQIPRSAWSAANLNSASARCASDRYSASPACACAAADFTAFTSKTREVAQARGNCRKKFLRRGLSGRRRKWFHPPSKFRKDSCRLRRRSSKHPRKVTRE